MSARKGFGSARSRLTTLLLASAAGCGLMASGAFAQSTNAGSPAAGAVNAGVSLGPSLGVASPASANVVGQPIPSGAAPLPAPEALVPQVNANLAKYGVAVLLDNVNEFAGIVSGPRTGSADAGQYGLELDADFEKSLNIQGLEFHIVTVGRYGIPTSVMFGDNIAPSQEIYGAGGNVVNHLVFAYFEETLANGRFDLQVGRIPVQNDYNSSPLFCNFQNNAFCGNPKEFGNNIAISSYPDANWAFNVRLRPVPTVYVQSGIYFTQSNIYSDSENFRSGWTIDASYISGETFPVEVGWEPAFGPDHLPGHYKAGFIYDNNNHDEVFDPSYLATGVHSVRKGSTTEYAQADQMLMRNGPGDTSGLIVFANYTHNDPNINSEEHEFNVAALDRGFWKARPQDAIDLGVSYIELSGSTTKQEELEQELGILPAPPPGNVPSSEGVSGLQTHAIYLELNYQVHVYRGITIAPDFQYFFRPNGQGNLPDAALLGFKSHVELF